MQLSQECAGRCAQDGSEHRERSRNDSGLVHPRFKVQPLLLLNAAPQHDSARAPAETHWLPTLVAATALDRQVEVLRALTSAAAPSQRGASTLESSRQSNPAWAFELENQGGTEMGLMGAYPPL